VLDENDPNMVFAEGIDFSEHDNTPGDVEIVRDHTQDHNKWGLL
jgi:hypothetical protein